MTGLVISPDLAPLPLEAVTSTFAILAKRGAGKTYTGSVLSEEMIPAGLRLCIIDPVGVWWGLRSSADGLHAGLPVVVFGGEHGDVELDAGDGERIADLVVDGTFSCVIDTSLFETKASVIRFSLAFFKRLYHRNRKPLHVIIDEADMFAPQRPMGEDAALLGAIENGVRRGRARGLGFTLITQRAAVLNKNVLTQIETLIVLRTTSPQDREAIDAWIEAQASTEQRKLVIDSLPSLKIGEAWVWSPAFLGVLVRVQIRKRHTFDSSATPKLGEVRVEPKALAPVDIDAIRAALAPKTKEAIESIESMQSADVRELNARIDELEATLAERDAQIAAFRAPMTASVIEELGRIREELQSSASKISDRISTCRESLAEERADLRDRHGLTGDAPAPSPIYAVPGMSMVDVPAPRRAIAPPPRTGESDAIGGGARRMLSALLSMHPVPMSRLSLAIHSGFQASAGGFRGVLSELSTHKLIDKEGGERGEIKLTSAGMREAGRRRPVSSSADLLAIWRPKLGGSANRMLAHLVAIYPRWCSRKDLAHVVEMNHEAGGFRGCLSELSVNELIEKQGGTVRASPSLFLGARR